MPELTKLIIARAQLRTALDLFTRDKDPISVHCLACGGGEVIEGIADIAQQQAFSFHIIKTQPNYDRRAIRGVRNQYWNAFKHVFKGDFKTPRDDGDLLSEFTDSLNDAALYAGWWDYLLVEKKLPVAAQVFQVWWYALNEKKVEDRFDFGPVRQVFPDIMSADRSEQKRRLRRVIEKFRSNKELLAHPRTEP